MPKNFSWSWSQCIFRPSNCSTSGVSRAFTHRYSRSMCSSSLRMLHFFCLGSKKFSRSVCLYHLQSVPSLQSANTATAPANGGDSHAILQGTSSLSRNSRELPRGSLGGCGGIGSCFSTIFGKIQGRINTVKTTFSTRRSSLQLLTWTRIDLMVSTKRRRLSYSKWPMSETISRLITAIYFDFKIIFQSWVALGQVDIESLIEENFKKVIDYFRRFFSQIKTMMF